VLAIPKDLDAAFHGILDAVRSGEIPESRIDESVLKILRAKEAIGLDKHRFVNVQSAAKTADQPRDLAFAQSIADRAMTLVLDNRSVLPLKKSDSAVDDNQVVFALFKYNIATDSGQKFKAAVLQRRPDARIFSIDANVAYGIRSELLEAVRRAKKVVVVTFVSFNGVREELVDGRLMTSFGVVGNAEDLLHEILDKWASKVAVVAVGSPYVIENFPAIQTYLCTFSPSSTSEISAAKAIFGEIPAEGKLPILLPAIADRGVGLQWTGSSLQQIASH
jgi:beta-N-acetylhexosaminidase